MANLSHVDLFSGFGMMALGVQRAGFDTRLFCEIEPYAQKVLAKHWPNVPIESDVRNVSTDTLRRYGIDRVDILTGGFPCQDISVAGKAKGLKGERSGLWYEMLRVIRECKPAFCLIENVPALRTRGVDTILEGLEKAGYSAECFVVGADDCGAPHRRKRVWIVAHNDSQRWGDGQHHRDRRYFHADEERNTEAASPVREELFPVYGKAGTDVAYSDRKRLQVGGSISRDTRTERTPIKRDCHSLFPPARNDFRGWATVASMDASLMPCVERQVRGVDDGSTRELYANRTARLKGLGNGLIWIIPFLIGSWIRDQITQQEGGLRDG